MFGFKNSIQSSLPINQLLLRSTWTRLTEDYGFFAECNTIALMGLPKSLSYGAPSAEHVKEVLIAINKLPKCIITFSCQVKATIKLQKTKKRFLIECRKLFR